MKFILAALLISAIAAIHIEKEETLRNNRHGLLAQKDAKLDVNIEKYEANTQINYMRPRRFHHIKRDTNSCSYTNSKSYSKSKSYSNDKKHYRAYKSFPRPVERKAEQVQVVKVGDAQ